MTLLAIVDSASVEEGPAPLKARLLVLTDITSNTARVREPDDAQSLVRLLVHANEFDIEGLLATANLGHGQVTRPELIRELVDGYEKVVPNLRLHDAAYPDAAALRRGIKAGNPVAGKDIPAEKCVGKDRDTEASEWIIARGDAPDARPLWITVWGGTADLAQALWKVAVTRSPSQAAVFRARLRIHAINDQDTTAAWIRETYPDVFYITRRFGIRGMYRGGDRSLVSSEWVEKNVRQGHGPLGALYPNYDGGDIWSSRLGRVTGIKEGDTPSFLYLLPNGLGNPDDPTLGSWGGRCQRDNAPHRFVDARDNHPEEATDPDPHMAATHRWRPAFQSEFAARMDWCVRPSRDANHPPVVRIAGERRRTARPGETITLDARASADPDGHAFDCRWSVYPPTEGIPADLPLRDAETPVARLTIPHAPGRTLPLLLTVTDRGDPPLTRYGRVFVQVV
jgi:hypothetical protein